MTYIKTTATPLKSRSPRKYLKLSFTVETRQKFTRASANREDGGAEGD